LYLGTEAGIYISFNDGASWQPLRLNLPITPVHGIVVEKRDLIIGTHGRGFYILDDINVLRQATPDVTTNALFVFQPNNATRGLDRNIAVDYYLAKDADEVKIDFLDGSGSVLRSFSGKPGQKPEAPGGDDNPFAFRPPPVSVGKGMNRFTWDLRQEGAVVFPDMIMWAAQPQRGPASPPGKYSVRITANGETKSRDFSVSVDPRLVAEGINEGALLEQFKLSTQVRDRVTEANTAVLRIRSVRDQINERMKTVPQRRRAEIQKLADAVLTPLTAVEEEIYQVRNRSSQDPLNYPIRLNNKIAALMGVIESSDNRPTDQTYEVFKELSAELEKQLERMRTTEKNDLERLNAALRREKVEAINPDAKPAAIPPSGAKPKL
jgi:hypothetical protein